MEEQGISHVKVSDDIVYARGLLNVQMSELVKFQLENELIYGIVNYLDNEGVIGIIVLGDALKLKIVYNIISKNK